MPRIISRIIDQYDFEGPPLSGKALVYDSATQKFKTLSINGNGSGTVNYVSGSGTVNGITLTGNVTSSGTLTLGGNLSNVSLLSQVSGILPIANGGTSSSTATGALSALGAIGSITSTNGSVSVTNSGTNVDLSVTGAVSTITSNNGSVAVVTSGTNVDLSVTVAAATNNVIVQVRNTTGATLTKGTIVYINNATGQTPTVAKAIATSDATSAQTLGMVSANISNNGVGYVTIIGLIDDINTNSYEDGDQLYLSSTTAGTFTNIKPYAPFHLVYVGVVEYAHQNHGKIFVKVQNGYELDELHNVEARYPTSGQTLIYNSASGAWQNSLLSLTHSVTGVLPVANGGTNASSLGTSGNVLYFDGSSVQGQNILLYSPTGIGINNSAPSGALHVKTSSSTEKALIVQGFNSQSGNLQEWQNSSGTILAQITNTANLGLGISPAAKYHQAIIGHTNTTTAPGDLQARWENDSNGGRESHLSLYHQYYPSFQIDRWFFVNNAGYSGGTTSSFGIGSLYASNNIFLRDMGLNFENVGIRFSQETSGLLRLSLEASNRGFYIGNGNGTSSDISTQIIPNVGFSIASQTHTNYLFNVTTAGTTIKPHSASTKGLIVQGATSQTANLQEWQNSSGTALSYIDASGKLYNNNILALPVSSGVGNNINITAGSGVGTGAGGNVVIVPGTQATSGGNGRVRISSDTAGTNYVAIDPNATQQVNFYCNTILAFTVSSYPSNRGYIGASSTGGFAWADNATGDFSNHLDLALSRDAADTLAQRRSTNAQAFRIYNTYTDASNYERAEMGWTGNVFNIVIANAGTGSVRRLGISSGTNVPINIGSTMEFQSGSRTLSWYSGDYFGLNNSEMVLGTVTNTNFSNSSVAVRNNTSPQNFRVYNTFTSSTAYERLGISWASNICTIGVEQAGGGVRRVLNVNANNLNAPTLPAAATVTAASGNGTTVTYTSANTFSVGQVVSITGLTITTGSSLNLANQTITTASSTQFTVTNSTVGTAVATQAGTATIQSAGNSVTITAGNASGSGAGGSLILRAGIQATTGGDGTVAIQQVSGQTSNLQEWQNSSSGILTSVGPSGAISLLPYGTGLGNTNEIRFNELAANGSHYVGFKAANTIPSSIVWTLPSGEGASGQALITNGSGLLSWASGNTGTVTSVSGTGSVNGLTLTGTVTSSGAITLGGTLSNVSLISAVTDTLPIANGGTNTTSLGSSGNILYFDGTRIQAQTLLNYTASGIRAISPSTTGKPLIIQGVTGQTANLQEWQNVSGTALSYLDASGNFYAISKSFLIDHPSSPDKKLRYASLEGPEHAVFYRGTLINKDNITLPYYWKDLVHNDSITVSLTPKKYAQPNLFVEEANNIKVVVSSDRPIYCDYIIYGTRKDVDMLEVETNVG